MVHIRGLARCSFRRSDAKADYVACLGTFLLFFHGIFCSFLSFFFVALIIIAVSLRRPCIHFFLAFFFSLFDCVFVHVLI